jgi:hypothetical protein
MKNAAAGLLIGLCAGFLTHLAALPQIKRQAFLEGVTEGGRLSELKRASAPKKPACYRLKDWFREE